MNENIQEPVNPELPSAVPPSKEEKTWAMFCHLGGFGLFLLPPIGNIIIPLIIWALKKQDSPFIDDQGKESLNFQISILIFLIISAVLVFLIIGFFLFLAVLIFDVIMIIVATVKSGEGQLYRYPLTFRFIK